MLDHRVYTFLDLCETMNYTKTAERLFITQPAVTGHIRWLEQLYGVKLFSYTAKKLALTEAGQALRQYALSARADQNRLQSMLAAQPNGRETLRFGATKTIGDFCMAQCIGDYMRLFPQVNLSMQVDNTRVLLQMLEQGEIEFALIEGFFASSIYEAKPICAANFVGVCGAGHPLAGKEIRFTDLLPHRLILREEGSGTRDIAEAILWEQNLEPHNFALCMETGSFELIRSLLCKNAGFSFVYENVVADGLTDGSIVPLQLKGFHSRRQMHLVYLKDRLFTGCISAFYSFLSGHPSFSM